MTLVIMVQSFKCQTYHVTHEQGCINRSSLPAGLGARGVSSEHVDNMENAEKMENMEMFSGSPT